MPVRPKQSHSALSPNVSWTKPCTRAGGTLGLCSPQLPGMDKLYEDGGAV